MSMTTRYDYRLNSGADALEVLLLQKDWQKYGWLEPWRSRLGMADPSPRVNNLQDEASLCARISRAKIPASPCTKAANCEKIPCLK